MKLLLILLFPVLLSAQEITYIYTENNCVWRIEGFDDKGKEKTYTVIDRDFTDIVKEFAKDNKKLKLDVPVNKSAKYATTTLKKTKKLKCKKKDGTGSELDYDIKNKTNKQITDLLIVLVKEKYYMWQDD